MTAENTGPQLSEISSKLDMLIRLSALALTKDIKDTAEKMKVLSYAGFDHAQIAEILDTTSHTVRQRLYELRKGIREPSKEEVSPTK